ncbi:MAG: hypothetical protein Q9218_006395 [Villophora microphyllina]
MSKVLLTVLTTNSYNVVVTVRSADKGRRLLSVYPVYLQARLSYVVVPDIAEDGAFDTASRYLIPSILPITPNTTLRPSNPIPPSTTSSIQPPPTI